MKPSAPTPPATAAEQAQTAPAVLRRRAMEHKVALAKNQRASRSPRRRPPPRDGLTTATSPGERGRTRRRASEAAAVAEAEEARAPSPAARRPVINHKASTAETRPVRGC